MLTWMNLEKEMVWGRKIAICKTLQLSIKQKK